MPIISEGITDTDFNGDPDTLVTNYNGGAFTTQVRFILNGGAGGSGTSDLAEQISITNTSGLVLSYHFFQYTDFDLNGSSGGDTAVFNNVNNVAQSEAGTILSETVITPAASHREIDFFANTLGSLNDGFATTLSDTPLGLTIGPGDVTWAFQWDVAIAPGATFLISKDKQITTIPEPSSFVLAAVGLIGLVVWRRRKQRS